MKNFKSLFQTTLLVCLAFVCVQCDNDVDDNRLDPIPLFTQEDMQIIHGNSSKSWRITEVINNYYNPNYDLEITLECVTDDIYTFHSDTEEVTITFGESLCFEDVEDGIFTADHEFFESNLLMLSPEGGSSIYLHFARGYVNEDQTAMGSTFSYYQLAELSENRMVFVRESEFIGKYNKALIFEVID